MCCIRNYIFEQFCRRCKCIICSTSKQDDIEFDKSSLEQEIRSRKSIKKFQCPEKLEDRNSMSKIENVLFRLDDNVDIYITTQENHKHCLNIVSSNENKLTIPLEYIHSLHSILTTLVTLDSNKTDVTETSV